MDIKLSRENLFTTESIVDGSNIRTVVWTQGCKHNCEGCHNPSTHSFKSGVLADADEVLEVLVRQGKSVTFSGGDPMEQPEACGYIAKKLREKGFNVWSYTGYTFEQILNDEVKYEFLKHLDVLVDGRFDSEQIDLTLAFRGSSNQRIIDVQKSLKDNKIVNLEM